MKLYEHQGFPNPRRVRIFLAEKGLTVPVQQVDLLNGENRHPEFLAKNPDGTVPVLEQDDGNFLSETVAISRYFEELQPEPALMGRTPEETAEIEMWQRRVESSLMEAFGTYFHHATDGLGDEGRYRNKEWGEHNLKKGTDYLGSLDKHLEGHQFIAANQFSIADITALCAIDVATASGVPIPEEYKNLHRWHREASSRPSAAA